MSGVSGAADACFYVRRGAVTVTVTVKHTFQVLWAEQQFSKQRSKRTPVADYNDPSWDAEWYIVSSAT